jgi:hypothetical protein
MTAYSRSVVAHGTQWLNGNWYQLQCQSCNYAGEAVSHEIRLHPYTCDTASCCGTTLIATLRGSGYVYPIYDIACERCGILSEGDLHPAPFNKFRTGCPSCKGDHREWVLVSAFKKHPRGITFAAQLELYYATHPHPPSRHRQYPSSQHRQHPPSQHPRHPPSQHPRHPPSQHRQLPPIQ